MSITQSLNSKANIKKSTNQDVPVGIIQNRTWSQVFGDPANLNPTTNSLTPVQCPEMVTTINSSLGLIDVSYSIAAATDTSGAQVYFQIYLDNQPVGKLKPIMQPSSGFNVVQTASDTVRIQTTPGVHTVAVYWHTSAGVSTAAGDYRNMLAKDA